VTTTATPIAAEAPAEAALSEIQGGSERAVRLGIHDASRIEWIVSIPLPELHGFGYVIEAELEVPTNAAARGTPWEQLQSFTRLAGPTAGSTSDDSTVDALRRGAVSLTHMLERAHDGFARHCKAAPRDEGAPLPGGHGFLTIWLDAALRAVQEAREKLTRPGGQDSPLIARERTLVDEFVSVRLLDMLGDSDRAARALAGHASLAAVSASVAQSLHDELAYRQMKGYLRPDARSAASLEQYVERAALLKKHFEEVLFLDRETEQLDERVQQWIAAFTALGAGVVVFTFQVALAWREDNKRLELGWGLVVLALIAGLWYAARDRLKEFSKTWLMGKINRFHAQRLTRCRIPARRRPTRDLVVRAKESFDQLVRTRPDALNPEAGASLAVTLIQYIHRGQVLPQPALTASGVTTIRHIFRYDLSPLFPRLADEMKRVPVMDSGGRVAFAEAPRRYRVPVVVRVRFQRETHEERVTVVLDKGGLRRVDAGLPEPAAE